jgi:uncharacterized LabA/DUF88 family protein
LSKALDPRVLLGHASLDVVVFHVAHSIDRPLLEAEIRRIAKGHRVDVTSRSREELARALFSFAETHKDVRRALGKQLLDATTLERGKLASMTDAWRTEVAPYLSQRRFTSKFLLGMLVLASLDGEPWKSRIQSLLSEIAATKDEAGETLKKAEAAGIAGEVQALVSAFEQAERSKGSLQEQVVTLEQERAAILARLGQHEAELKRVQDHSKLLERELQQVQKRPAVVTPQPMDDDEETSALRKKLRRLEKQASFARDREQDRDRLKLLEAEREALLREYNVMRTQLQLSQVQAAQRELMEMRPRDNVKPEPRVPTPVQSQKEKHTGLFVDGANLSGAARESHGRKVDFAALHRLLIATGEAASATAYVIDNGAEGFDAFSRALRSAGFAVRRRAPKLMRDGTQKANQDIEIAIDVMEQRERFSRVVLVTGDSDFVPLVRSLKRSGIRVEAAMFRAHAAKELMAEVDAFIVLGETVLI